ncbi:hypothetical protein [Nonomuraea pusilla]|uniref:Uncharacterized protein n=1 Tax=Nonomuraea pusilla TaxID=46177 RepID=A0A1H8A318_9ACTN|nr:hypothetical protein [Nonomuraea pusilla]SEM64238.1 hypothetical protein SAMN05660976_05718 [Nonomuraea pusilla]
MPDIESHQPIDYQLADRGLQEKGFIVTEAAAGDLEVVGTCPACLGTTASPWTYGLAGGKGVFKRQEKAKPRGPRTVYCECGYMHPNRPDTAWDLGCGAYWQVELPS